MSMTRFHCPEHGPLSSSQIAPGYLVNCGHCGRAAMLRRAALNWAPPPGSVVIPRAELMVIAGQCTDPDTRLALWSHLEATHAHL